MDNDLVLRKVHYLVYMSELVKASLETPVFLYNIGSNDGDFLVSGVNSTEGLSCCAKIIPLPWVQYLEGINKFIFME